MATKNDKFKGIIKKIFLSISFWIFVFMILGFIVGVFAPKRFSLELEHISILFLNLIKMLIVPLIFSTLVVGISSHSNDTKKIGGIALKSFIYFEVFTTIALVLGLLFVNIFRPGIGISASYNQNDTLNKETNSLNKNNGLNWYDVINHTVPSSFFMACANNEVLQVVFCAIVFAIGILKVKNSPKNSNNNQDHTIPMLKFLNSLSIIMFKVTQLVMNFAPVGIGCALAYTIAKSGIQVFLVLFKLVATLYGALLVYLVLVLFPVLIICKISLKQAFRCIGKPALIAFSTASSEAALPLAMENLQKLGCSNTVVGFVMPAGYSFNLDGTSLHLSIASIFCAQVSNINLSISQQIILMLTLVLTSKGVAAVPRASLVILSATVTSFGIPLNAVNLIIGVDAIMDMGRTSINLIGNCVATIAIAVWSNEFNRNSVVSSDSQNIESGSITIEQKRTDLT